ncbi:MAG: FAD-binding oxidoreductase [Candidatus Omnitrophica bacterium]|nr:FAD-binding oxidoreductase [Candidatus Omnitrophota bacterium]
MKRYFLFITLLVSFGCRTSGVTLNDVHSQLNATLVDHVFYPKNTDDVVNIILKAKKEKKSISISGGKHAMGGQQFGVGTLHISLSEMTDVLAFDEESGIVKVEAGITWPLLIDYLLKAQEGKQQQWGIRQKQTGADYLTVGGALSANAHGRGLAFKPIIEDVVSFTLIDAEGNIRMVSRQENPELFSLVIGGYGLFGVIATIDLQLTHRQKLERRVEVIAIEDLPAKAKQRIDEGALYGDYQYKTDEQAEDFMRSGVLATYHPVSDDTPMPENQKQISKEKWKELVRLAHTDKGKAFELYSDHYRSTDGQIYWSDTHQMSYYFSDYHDFVNQSMPGKSQGSLMITEVYVPRNEITGFIEKIREDALTHDYNIIYGTLRLIKKDDESFLAWAKDDYACVIFNLRVEHTPEGLKKAEHDFQKIIDRALELNGSYFLTYHRWARPDQVFSAYPQFPEFLRLKLKYDPDERFQSEWYRHYKQMFK